MPLEILHLFWKKKDHKERLIIIYERPAACQATCIASLSFCYHTTRALSIDDYSRYQLNSEDHHYEFHLSRSETKYDK